MLNVKTTGFINFNDKFNKVLKNGAVTVSVSHSVRQADGEYKNEYINGIIPAKFVEDVKPMIGKLVDISGSMTLTPTEKGQVYANLTIFEAKEHQKKESKQETTVTLPF